MGITAAESVAAEQKCPTCAVLSVTLDRCEEERVDRARENGNLRVKVRRQEYVIAGLRERIAKLEAEVEKARMGSPP